MKRPVNNIILNGGMPIGVDTDTLRQNLQRYPVVPMHKDVLEQILRTAPTSEQLLLLLRDRDSVVPAHAAMLLIEVSGEAAIGPILDALVAQPNDDSLIHNVYALIPEFGKAAVEPLFARLNEATDGEVRNRLLFLLANAGVRDERIYTALVAYYDEDPELGADLWGDYDDERMRPLIERELARYLDLPRSTPNVSVIEFLAESLERVLIDGDDPDRASDHPLVRRAHAAVDKFMAGEGMS